jgi:hypothetical protein
MDSIFRELILEGFVIVYMDDILIFSQTKDHLKELTKRVLKILQENDLFLKPEKCSFCVTTIKYLGLIYT